MHSLTHHPFSDGVFEPFSPHLEPFIKHIYMSHLHIVNPISSHYRPLPTNFLSIFLYLRKAYCCAHCLFGFPSLFLSLPLSQHKLNQRPSSAIPYLPLPACQIAPCTAATSHLSHYLPSLLRVTFTLPPLYGEAWRRAEHSQAAVSTSTLSNNCYSYHTVPESQRKSITMWDYCIPIPFNLSLLHSPPTSLSLFLPLSELESECLYSPSTMNVKEFCLCDIGGETYSTIQNRLVHMVQGQEVE